MPYAHTSPPSQIRSPVCHLSIPATRSGQTHDAPLAPALGVKTWHLERPMRPHDACVVALAPFLSPAAHVGDCAARDLVARPEPGPNSSDEPLRIEGQVGDVFVGAYGPLNGIGEVVFTAE